MLNISIHSEFLKKWPQTHLGILVLNLKVKSNYPDLLQLIEEKCQSMRTNILMEDISKTPAIAQARKAYKAVGKDPARYRLSAEALTRRVINGKGLYQVNNVVDGLNLISISSGISIGGYDVEKIEGDISLGIGKANEPYEAIGRGALNMEFMPILRDQKSSFGSPTSDSTRTMVTKHTNKFLMVFFDFEGNERKLEKILKDAVHVMNQHADANVLYQTILND